MPEYDFRAKPLKSNKQPESPARDVAQPVDIPGRPELPDNSKSMLVDPINTDFATEVRKVFTKGFETHDLGVINFFSTLQVPDKLEGFRPVNVRLAGGDRSILIWKQDLKNGRVRLPVLSVNRGSASYNVAKFSPPYTPIRKRFSGSEKNRIVKTYRPSPWNIEYQITAWTEHKSDAEYILYQIMSRFNPLADWFVQDEFMGGSVQAHFNGYTDVSDKEAASNQWAKVRYDFSITIEAWLPLPEEITPAILGRITTMQEFTGEFLGNIKGEQEI